MVDANAVRQADCAAKDTREGAELCYFATGGSWRAPGTSTPSRNGLVEDLGGDGVCDWVVQNET